MMMKFLWLLLLSDDYVHRLFLLVRASDRLITRNIAPQHKASLLERLPYTVSFEEKSSCATLVTFRVLLLSCKSAVTALEMEQITLRNSAACETTKQQN